jgi:hypothetical protein
MVEVPILSDNPLLGSDLLVSIKILDLKMVHVVWSIAFWLFRRILTVVGQFVDFRALKFVVSVCSLSGT